MAEESFRILLVDDKSDFRFSARLVLERAGFRVAEARTGEEALYRVLVAQRRDEPFDLLVTDLRMPGISGLELLDEIRAREAPVPPCILTGSGTPPSSSGGNTGEILEWMEKPFSPGALIDRVKAVLARRKDQAA